VQRSRSFEDIGDITIEEQVGVENNKVKDTQRSLSEIIP
jgi:hypothetical protein